MDEGLRDAADYDVLATIVPKHSTPTQHNGDNAPTTSALSRVDRAKRSTRNHNVQYDELSPKKVTKLRRLPGILPDTCKLAIGPSQQYDGGQELYLDQTHYKKGTIIAYYEGELITAVEKDLRESRYIFAIPTGENSEIYIDAANPLCGYARYADDSFFNGTENAVFSTVGHGSATRLALIAIDNIIKGTPIRATYEWKYWYQPKVFTLELMRKAFAGYIEAIGAVEDVQGAWDFAMHVGGTDALLEQWRGTRKHETSIQEDHDGAEDAHQPQSTSHDSEVLDQRSRPVAGYKRKH